MARQLSLLGESAPPDGREELAPGAVILRGFVRDDVRILFAVVEDIARAAPFRNMVTPGGYTMSVAMTNAGSVGWVTDRTGYRYDPTDPESRRPWPALPTLFLALADRAAAAMGFPGFVPDSCLINRYTAGTKLSLHQDRNEQDFSQPIVSVSLGLPAKFLFGGAKRNERARRVPLYSGDVVVWGGPARLFFHGVDTLADGVDEVTGACRVNLTFRKAL